MSFRLVWWGLWWLLWWQHWCLHFHQLSTAVLPSSLLIFGCVQGLGYVKRRCIVCWILKLCWNHCSWKKLGCMSACISSHDSFLSLMSRNAHNLDLGWFILLLNRPQLSQANTSYWHNIICNFHITKCLTEWLVLVWGNVSLISVHFWT